jgi:hypothetical protein
MQVHLLTAPGILVIWAVTHPSTNRAQRCLTLVIKWVPVCPTWQMSLPLPLPLSFYLSPSLPLCLSLLPSLSDPSFSLFLSPLSPSLSPSHLIWVLSRIALAFSADAVSPVVAERRRRVVRAAAALQVAVEIHVFGVALAAAAEKVGRARADAAHVRAVAVALHGVANVALEKRNK